MKEGKIEKEKEVRNLGSLRRFFGATLALTALVFCGTAAAQEVQVLANTGNPDGKLGALSRPPSVNKVETETADDFFLRQTSVITGATITGLLKDGATLANIENVEVEIYNVFPVDSVNRGTDIAVPTRKNSPADNEIAGTRRALSDGTLVTRGITLNANFSVLNSVVTGINKKPLNTTHGEGSATGEEVEIDITFSRPIILSPGRHFFRPEVQPDKGDFLFLSAPKPIVAPGQPIAGDLQAWIRDANLAPDWLRIGTDIIGTDVPGGVALQFNMTFSLSGITIPGAGTPDEANCNGQTVDVLNELYGNQPSAARGLRFRSVQDLEKTLHDYCGE